MWKYWVYPPVNFPRLVIADDTGTKNQYGLYLCQVVHGSVGLGGENLENDFSHDFYVIIIYYTRGQHFIDHVVLDGHEVESPNYKIKALCYSVPWLVVHLVVGGEV